MLRVKFPLPLMAMLLVAVCPAARAGPPALTVTAAWVRAIPGAPAAAYMTLHNGGTRTVRIIGVRSPLARMAMIHETRVVGGVSTMRAHEPLAVAPGATVRLAPEGLHVMLDGLAHPLAAGTDVPLELLLEGGGRIAVSARVRPLGAE
ncbi:MAG TPA: copper chaperone PCu(A)C [Steroidobacteraceae bacterium]|nr:copper chaperone PCu(A)C [Steroidobacteraceae bacterium]